MKRLLLIGVLLLLLTGCNAAPEDALDETTDSSVSFYVPNSPIEQETGGALALYQPEEECQALYSMGQKLLLRSNDGTLTALTGAGAAQTAVYEMGPATSLYTAQTGIAYYRQSDRAVVTCNTMLQETGSYTLPEGISGVPVVNLSSKEIYFCVGKEIRATDMVSGISRLIKEYTSGTPALTGGLFESTVLVCELSGDQKETHYISTQNGQTLSKNSGITHIQTGATNYFLRRTDGLVPQMICGNLNTGAKNVNLLTDGLTVLGVPEKNGAIAWQTGEEGLTLSYYDFSSGKRIAAITLKNLSAPTSIASNDKDLWLLAQLDGKQALLRWNIELSPVQDETVYTGTLFTAANPDTAGISQCQKKADSLKKTYGIRFNIWKDAVKVTGGYSLQPEYQTSVINGFLDELTKALAPFPTGFLRGSIRSGYVNISFVREITGEEDYVLFHKDGSAYIVIAAGAKVDEALYHAAGYLVDSYVLGNSRDYDDWNLLNPEGFVYGEEVSPAHLTESARYFIDEQATKSPRDDRQRIFAYAMQADKANYFSTDAMQAKLRMVCGGIREAYGVEKKQQTYPWEQHLTKPMFTK